MGSAALTLLIRDIVDVLLLIMIMSLEDELCNATIMASTVLMLHKMIEFTQSTASNDIIYVVSQAIRIKSCLVELGFVYSNPGCSDGEGARPLCGTVPVITLLFYPERGGGS